MKIDGLPRWARELILYLFRKHEANELPDNERMEITAVVLDGVLYDVRLTTIEKRNYSSPMVFEKA